jgi:DNA/RNA endonuclease YhcR with UshA esterase domain
MFIRLLINYGVMKDDVLLKISLISALLGIVILFIFSKTTNVDSNTISNIDSTGSDSIIKINGVVTDVSVRGSTTTFNVAQLDKINVFVFDSNISLMKGDYIEVTGKMQEYNGKTSLIADKIVLK